MKSLFSFAALAALSVVASAGTYTFSGALTATSPTFNRPLAGTPPTGLSAAGTNVSYSLLRFTVSAAGSYTLTGNATLLTGTVDDGFGVLYGGTFNPASPLTNAVSADDDTGPGSNYLITSTLATGTTYTLVSTTFSNATYGTFADVISGPGNITPVPEPSAFAALGLGAVAMLRRRRKA